MLEKHTHPSTGGLVGTLEEFSQYWNISEKEVEDTFQSLVEMGAMDRKVKTCPNKKTGEMETLHIVSLTKFAMERPDLLGYISQEEYEEGLKKGVEYKLGLCDECAQKKRKKEE